MGISALQLFGGMHPAIRPLFINLKNSPSEQAHGAVPSVPSEMRMYRVLVAVLLAVLAVQLSGCTGSLRLGSSVQVVEIVLASSHV
jgi:hypothetical protein